MTILAAQVSTLMGFSVLAPHDERVRERVALLLLRAALPEIVRAVGQAVRGLLRRLGLVLVELLRATPRSP